LLVPGQSDPKKGIGWDEIRLKGQEDLAVRASKKLVENEMLIPKLGGVRLKMDLDKIPLWRGDHVHVKQLFEDFAQYLYLPRLKNSNVIQGAIEDGTNLVTWRNDSFAYADAWDEEKNHYRGLIAGEQKTLMFSQESVIVKPEIADAQLEEEREKAEEGAGITVSGGEETGEGAEPVVVGEVGGVVAPAKPKRFYGSIQLDPDKWSLEATTIAEEVVQHFTGKVGTDVKITLEIEAESGEGFKEDTVRTVKENCNTLGFHNAEFEEE